MTMNIRKSKFQSTEPVLPYIQNAVNLTVHEKAHLSSIDQSKDERLTAIEIMRGMIRPTNHRTIGRLFTETSPLHATQASALFYDLPPSQQAALIPMMAHSTSTNLLMSLIPHPGVGDYRDISYLLKELPLVDGNARFCGYVLYTLQKNNPGLDNRIIDDIPYNLGVASGGLDVRTFLNTCRSFNEHLKSLRTKNLEDIIHYPSAEEALYFAKESALPLHGASFQTIDDYGFYFPMSHGLTILVMQNSDGRKYGITIPDAIGYGGRFQSTKEQPSLSMPATNQASPPEFDEPAYNGYVFYGDSPEMAGPISQTLMDAHTTASLEELGHIRASQETVQGYEASLTIFKEILRRNPSRKDIYLFLDTLNKAINDMRSTQ
jgi:hypothetical protein